MKASIEISITTALGIQSKCSNVSISGYPTGMLAIGTARVDFEIESNDPNMKSTLDTVLTDGTVSQQLAIQGFEGYTFTASSFTSQNLSESSSSNVEIGSTASSNTTTPTTSSGMIAGIVVGMLALLAVGVVVVYYLYRYKDYNIRQEQDDATAREASQRFDFSDIHQDTDQRVDRNGFNNSLW